MASTQIMTAADAILNCYRLMSNKVVPYCTTAICVLLLWAQVGCNSSSADVQSARTLNHHPLQAFLQDSIPLFNDTLSFSFFNAEKIASDTVLAYQYPILNLSLLDSKGSFKKEISRKGVLKEQFISAFINTRFGPDGKLYVLEEGNVPRLTIFSNDLQYLRSISLADKIGNHYIPTLKSSFYIDFPDAAKDSMILHVNIGSILFHPSSMRLYQQDSSIAVIYISKGEVKDVQFKVPLHEVQKVKSGLAEGRKDWDSPIPQFRKQGQQFYLKYEFDDHVYVYDNNWKPVNTFKVNLPYEFPGYSTSFEPIKDHNKSVEADFRLRYQNPFCYSMDVYGNKLFMLYYKPPGSSNLPRNVSEERKYNPVSVLHVLDMNTRQEYTTELPGYVSPYGQVTALNENEVLLAGNNKRQEDINIFKFRVNYEK
jgi:hypothetical protein